MISGPIGPSGSSGIGDVAEAGDVGDVADVGDAGDVADVGGATGVAGTSAAAATAEIQELAAAVDAGAVSPGAALEQLLENSLSTDLNATQRAELRELVTDLAASDPHLASLLARLG